MTVGYQVSLKQPKHCDWWLSSNFFEIRMHFFESFLDFLKFLKIDLEVRASYPIFLSVPDVHKAIRRARGDAAAVRGPVAAQEVLLEVVRVAAELLDHLAGRRREVCTWRCHCKKQHALPRVLRATHPFYLSTKFALRCFERAKFISDFLQGRNSLRREVYS